MNPWTLALVALVGGLGSVTAAVGLAALLHSRNLRRGVTA